jgi:hypothetical protein
MRLTTKSVLPIFVFLFSGMIVSMVAADPTLPPKTNAPANASGVLLGQLLKIEGEIYVVKDAGGKEVRLHVGKNTALDARIKVGDKIEAQVGPDGHALTVLKALE